MDFLKIVSIGLISTIIVLLLKETKPEWSVLVGIVSGIVIVVLCIDAVWSIVVVFFDLADRSGIDNELFSTLLQIVGIGYISEFSSNICSDAGNKGTADKILFAGKICIMLLALPIINSLFVMITEILP